MSSDLVKALIAAFIVGLLLIALIVTRTSTRETRYAAMGMLEHRAAATSSQLDANSQGARIQHLLIVTGRR